MNTETLILPSAHMEHKHSQELLTTGFTTIPGVYTQEEIDSARALVLKNRHLMKNTRPTASSGHLAGFHRYPQLEKLHSMLTGSFEVNEVLRAALHGAELRSIGLSDITINRSQHWHKDLLRGKFSHYINDKTVQWDTRGGSVFKILLYLQDGSSLKIVRGSHCMPVSLENDRHSEPHVDETVSTVPVKCGDIVIMDIRCSHRGADESAYIQGQWDHSPRILVSTAIGADNHPLTLAMEKGNFDRMIAWMARHTKAGEADKLQVATGELQ